jgi:hypothetical protein
MSQWMSCTMNRPAGFVMPPLVFDESTMTVGKGGTLAFRVSITISAPNLSGRKLTKRLN